MANVQEHLDLLGRRATDKVTGMRGVITSISFDLYGCVQGLLNPGVTEGNKLGELYWLDVSRLQMTDERVMPLPRFDFDKGPECKPTFH